MSAHHDTVANNIERSPAKLLKSPESSRDHNMQADTSAPWKRRRAVSRPRWFRSVQPGLLCRYNATPRQANAVKTNATLHSSHGTVQVNVFAHKKTHHECALYWAGGSLAPGKVQPPTAGTAANRLTDQPPGCSSTLPAGVRCRTPSSTCSLQAAPRQSGYPRQAPALAVTPGGSRWRRWSGRPEGAQSCTVSKPGPRVITSSL